MWLLLLFLLLVFIILFIVCYKYIGIKLISSIVFSLIIIYILSLLSVRQQLFSSSQFVMVIYSVFLLVVPIVICIYALVRCLNDLKHYKLIKCEECSDYQEDFNK